MRTLTDLALNKMANTYLDSLSHVLYKLDGVEKQIDFFFFFFVGNIYDNLELLKRIKLS